MVLFLALSSSRSGISNKKLPGDEHHPCERRRRCAGRPLPIAGEDETARNCPGHGGNADSGTTELFPERGSGNAQIFRNLCARKTRCKELTDECRAHTSPRGTVSYAAGSRDFLRRTFNTHETQKREPYTEPYTTSACRSTLSAGTRETVGTAGRTAGRASRHGATLGRATAVRGAECSTAARGPTGKRAQQCASKPPFAQRRNSQRGQRSGYRGDRDHRVEDSKFLPRVTLAKAMRSLNILSANCVIA